MAYSYPVSCWDKNVAGTNRLAVPHPSGTGGWRKEREGEDHGIVCLGKEETVCIQHGLCGPGEVMVGAVQD